MRNLFPFRLLSPSPGSGLPGIQSHQMENTTLCKELLTLAVCGSWNVIHFEYFRIWSPLGFSSSFLFLCLLSLMTESQIWGCYKAQDESAKYIFAYFERPLFSVKFLIRKKYKNWMSKKKKEFGLCKHILEKWKYMNEWKIRIGQCFSFWKGSLAC